ncbi:MAG: hypothetical protein LBB88_01700 [Planctomycetaceae bacterium]|nr:hypothetical protein [Planctomycetaceae bacterium]
MILIIVESILSLSSATRPFGERLRTYGRLPMVAYLLSPLIPNLKTRELLLKFYLIFSQ